MTCLYHYSIVTEQFHCLKNPSCSTYCLLPPSLPNLWQPLIFFHSFAFSRVSYGWNHTVRCLSDWLLSLGNMHFCFDLFVALSFIFLLMKNMHWMNVPVYPFTCWTSWLLVSFGNYEQRCFKPLCAGFCVNRGFRLIWVNTKDLQ